MSGRPVIALIAELLTKLDGVAMIAGQAGLAQAWDPWKALRDELGGFGYPTLEEYEEKLKAAVAAQIAEALS